MQLAINSKKSAFIRHSEKFNHFIYELKRAQFGPITEMCKVWMASDLRADFYEEKLR